MEKRQYIKRDCNAEEYSTYVTRDCVAEKYLSEEYIADK